MWKNKFEKSKDKYFKNITYSKLEKWIRGMYSIESPDFFDLNETFDKDITNPNKN